MIITLNAIERQQFRKLWRPCRMTVQDWVGVDTGALSVPMSADPFLVLTAADPYGVDLSDEENRRLDRKFGQDVTSEWWRVTFTETHRQTKGFLFRHQNIRTSLMLLRWAQQLAAFVWLDTERHLLWHDGDIEPFPLVPR